MHRATASSLLAAALLAACAKQPDAIAPLSFGDTFASVPCGQAARMLGAERQVLAALESQQRSAAMGDAVGVFLIGVPVSSLGNGDKEGAVAASKGKVLSLENRMLSC